MRHAAIIGLIVGSLTGCRDDPYDPEAPAIDPSAPRVHITSPRRGTFAGDVETLLVIGTVRDDTAVASVRVNGLDATLAGDGSWQVMVPVETGTQLLRAVATDVQGNVGKESRAVVSGPLEPIATAVPQAITAAVSAQTFHALGRALTGYLRTGDLAAVVAPLNPVIDAGDGPDCLYAQASITRIAVGSDTAVALLPRPGGLALAVDLDDVEIGVRVRYAVACFDGSRDITVRARLLRVSGNVNAAIVRGAFDVTLDDQHIQLTGFSVDLGGLPDDIVDMLHLESVVAPVLGWATESFVVPLLGGALTGLVNGTGTVSVLGTPVDIKVMPARIDLDTTGAIIELDTSLRARGDTGSPGYVYVANQVPAMSTERGFALAVADDAANQLLGSYWAAGGLDRAFDLTTGSYGQIGTLYDRVELSAAVPPFVDASDGALRLTIGDLIATFKNGSSVATRVAVNAQVDIQVVTGLDGRPRLDVGTPTTYVDVLDDNVDGANALSNAQFEVITSFALGRVIAVGSGAVGAIPLPSFGGVALRDVGIAERAGYLVLDGEIQ
jgi:hypothetical protein